MTIYSKSEKFHHINFNRKKFKNLKIWTPSSNDIFYHHFYDDQQYGIKFKDCIDEIHWDHLRSNPSTILFHENCGETFNYNFINEIDDIIRDKHINPSQIYIFVMDQVHKEFLNNNLKKLGITNINIEVYNHLLRNVQLENEILPSLNKFSALSRNYRIWRLKLYCDLIEKNLLKEFLYSFYNIHPYEKKVFTLVDILDDLNKLKIKVNDNLLEWIYKIPYRINSTDNVYNKWADVTYQIICSADIHLTIETHFDPFLNNNSENVYDKNFAPSSITEKTYKPIACKKPFMVFSTPYFLEDLKKMGYKTFNGCIDESYDLEVDNFKRLNLIVSEIERISKLSENEYKKLLEDMNEICEHNYKLLIRNKNSSMPIFLRDLVNA